jgi:tetratricopeptide (TPR) repeat protein
MLLLRVAALLTGFLPWISQGAEVDSLLEKADALDRQGRNVEALAVCLEAEKIAPNDPEVLRLTAKQYAQSVLDGKNDASKRAMADKAIHYARRALAVAPKDALVHLSLAICYARAATVAENKAKIAYAKLIKQHADTSLALDPGNDLTYFVLGSWCYEMANLNGFLRGIAKLLYGTVPSATNQDAARYLEKAVALNPRRICSHAALGRCYKALGDRERAKTSLRRALALPESEKGDNLVKEQAREDLSKL